MQIIPVLDLMAGAVVHARRGERDAYRPIRSSLCDGSEPGGVTAALLALAPFSTVYIADLDAIRRHGENQAVVAALGTRFPGVEIWLDRGETDPQALRSTAERSGVPVLGTETLPDMEAARPALAVPGIILSLDRDAAGPRGPLELHEEAGLWPDRLIVMTLARVGSGAGPDFELLSRIRDMAGPRQVFAAGGVRDVHDLECLRDIGVAGVLVASALHDGRLTERDLLRFTSSPNPPPAPPPAGSPP